jgi:hypothetical protein
VEVCAHCAPSTAHYPLAGVKEAVKSSRTRVGTTHMRNLKPLILVMLSAACLHAGAFEAAAWRRYTNREAGYSIEFPVTPSFTRKTRTLFGRQVPETVLTYDAKTSGLILKECDLTGVFDVSGHETQFLAHAAKASHWPGAKVSRVGDHIKVVKAGMELRLHTFIHRDRYIELLICGRVGQLDMRKRKRFVDSLRLF